MFAKYQYLTTSTAAQVQADIRAILTGETLVANLSASCNTANSSINTTYDVAGWTSYDTAAYTTGFALRRFQQDGVTYKYATFELPNTSQWALRVVESWDNVAHTGTNEVSSGLLSWASTSGGIFYIYASADVICIRHSDLSGTTLTTCPVIYEMDNTDGMIGAGYPTSFLVVQTESSVVPNVGTACRIKHPSAVGDLTTSSAFAIPLLGAGGTQIMAASTGTTYRDSSENLCVCFMPPAYGFSSVQYGVTAQIGIIGRALGKVRFSPPTYTLPAIGDTIVLGSTTIRCIMKGASTGAGFWVAEG